MNELGLDLKLLLYADDSTLIYTGSGNDREITRVLNRAIHIIGYVSRRLGLILQILKQKYFVVAPGRSSTRLWPDLKELYLDLRLDDVPLTKEYKSITYLGLRIDPRMTWSVHVNYVAQNATRIYIKIYHRFKNSSWISAEWMRYMLRTYVLTKVSYLIEIWSRATQTTLTPVETLHNNAVRLCSR